VSGDRTGIVVRRSADEMFEQRAQSLTAALTEQMDLYEAEQRTLQVVLHVFTTSADVWQVSSTLCSHWYTYSISLLAALHGLHKLPGWLSVIFARLHLP